jgi:predicted nucleic acid-binding protein
VILHTSDHSAFANRDSKLRPIITAAPEVAIPVIVCGEYKYDIKHCRYSAEYELAGVIAANDLWIAALARQARYLS